MPVQRFPVNSPEVAIVDSRSPTFMKPSWYRRRTILEKILLVLLLVSLIVIILLAIFVALGFFGGSRGLCVTDDCINTAVRILSAMDSTIDPCDDFFEYACGTWNKINTIPNDRPTYNTFRKLDDQLQEKLRVLLESSVQINDISAIKKAKWLYQSCVNMSLIEERKGAPLVELLTILGGWPVLNDSWDATKFDMENLLGQLKLIGNVVLVNLAVGSDGRDSDVNVIQMDQGPLGLPSREYFLKNRTDQTLMTYQQLAIDIAVALGASRENAERDIAAMVDFEIELANITMPEEQHRDTVALYTRFTLDQLQFNISSNFDWRKYFNIVFSNVSIAIDADEPVVVYASHYLQRTFELTKATSNRTLANYILWQVVMSRVGSLHQGLLDLRRSYNKVLLGTVQDRERWRICTSYVNEKFGMAVGRMFVEKHFDDRAKTNVVWMIQRIREAFAELLKEIPWMSEETKKVAQEKADAIQEMIGFPDYIKNDTALNLDYEEISLSPSTYFENIFVIHHFYARLNLKKLRHPVARDQWSSTPAVVNAFYNAAKNQITIPAGILHPPFYHENFPMYLNLGGIAVIIGHELTHGFDDRGRLYDKNGNIKQWWAADDIERFKEKAQCIINQYSNYSVSEVGMMLNGAQTQSENIADNGGLKQAYKAYSLWTDKNGPEQSLPGIDLSHDQLFFLSFAQMWCGMSRPEYYTQSLRTGRHSPGKLRVCGTVSNSVEFSRAFNCSLGSRMNPVNKCSVW